MSRAPAAQRFGVRGAEYAKGLRGSSRQALITWTAGSKASSVPARTNVPISIWFPAKQAAGTHLPTVPAACGSGCHRDRCRVHPKTRPYAPANVRGAFSGPTRPTMAATWWLAHRNRKVAGPSTSGKLPATHSNRSRSLRRLCRLYRLDSFCSPCTPGIPKRFGYRLEMSGRPPCRRHRTSPGSRQRFLPHPE